MYSLQGLRTKLKATALWLKMPVSYEAMIPIYGTGDKAWRTVGSPIGSLVVYNASLVQLTTPTNYSVSNLDTGVIVFPAAINYTPLASYDIQEVGDATLLEICQSGFERMQTLWPRELYIYDDTGTLVISSASGTGVDPVIGTTTFSQSVYQQALLLDCALWVLAETLHQRSIAEMASYREERTGGLAVDTTRQPKEYAAWVVAQESRVREALASAQQEAGVYEQGAAIGGPRSDEYLDHFDRYTGSRHQRGVL